jgi:hypothetical protein
VFLICQFLTIKRLLTHQFRTKEGPRVHAQKTYLCFIKAKGPFRVWNKGKEINQLILAKFNVKIYQIGSKQVSESKASLRLFRQKKPWAQFNSTLIWKIKEMDKTFTTSSRVDLALLKLNRALISKIAQWNHSLQISTKRSKSSFKDEKLTTLWETSTSWCRSQNPRKKGGIAINLLERLNNLLLDTCSQQRKTF